MNIEADQLKKDDPQPLRPPEKFRHAPKCGKHSQTSINKYRMKWKHNIYNKQRKTYYYHYCY
jgi:hypothetical protein